MRMSKLEASILRIKAKYMRQVEKALTDPIPSMWDDPTEYRLSGVHDAVSACKKEINLLKAKIEARNAQSLRDTEQYLLLREREDVDKI